MQRRRGATWLMLCGRDVFFIREALKRIFQLEIRRLSRLESVMVLEKHLM
jgi:hypothetical protein